jgi:D-inositol-3-phosphate glycosyltransferase
VKGLRVHLVSEHASPLATVGGADAGGQNVHVAALATGLARLGCEVTVLTRADDPDLPIRVDFAPGVVVEHVVAGPLAPIARDELWPHMREMAHRLRIRWRGEPPDLVHAHFWMSGWAARRALARMPNPPPLILTFHALGVVKRRHQGTADTSPPARNDVERQLLGEVDEVMATCSDEVEELRALGAPDDRIRVVPCGVDTSAFRPDGAQAPPRRGGHRVVAVSRLVARKGIDDIIAALPRLPGTELLVAGGPPGRQLAADPEATRLRALADELGVGRRVRLLGAVSRADVPPLLRSADVVACVPWYEPFGIVPLEAMACGTPVVGSAVGGLLDTVAHGRTGLLVPPHDPEAVTAAIQRLLDNPSLRVRMGEEAVARVRQAFTWSQVARSTLDVYRELVSEARPAAGDRRWTVSA